MTEPILLLARGLAWLGSGLVFALALVGAAAILYDSLSSLYDKIRW